MKINYLFILFFVVATNFGYSQNTYGTLVVSKINSVYDGDTFRADIVGVHPLIGDNAPIRLAGVDTPEIRGKCQLEKDLAVKAREFVKNKLFNAERVELRNIERGKYFRIVAEVYIDGVNLSTLLLQNNLAYEYTGGRKLSWCD